MSKDRICILFSEVPEKTHFIKSSYSWVNETEALEYIKKGFGVQYDPVKKEVIERPKEDPFTNLPDDFPGREHLIQAGICLMELVLEMKDFDQIPGIGQVTEKRILEYLKK